MLRFFKNHETALLVASIGISCASTAITYKTKQNNDQTKKIIQERQLQIERNAQNLAHVATETREAVETAAYRKR